MSNKKQENDISEKFEKLLESYHKISMENKELHFKDSLASDEEFRYNLLMILSEIANSLARLTEKEDKKDVSVLG